MRMSNFLLWQAAYSELFFSDCLWPDFGEAEIDAALAAYANRDRRFGGIAAAAVSAHVASPGFAAATAAASSNIALAAELPTLTVTPAAPVPVLLPERT